MVAWEKRRKVRQPVLTIPPNWPISAGHSTVSGCCLCSARSTDPNPLVEEVDDAAAMEAHRPWANYRKVDKHFVRVPEGKGCLPCLNVFRLLGKRKYDTYQAYYKRISQKANQAAQNEHKDFLASLKQWLKQHRENPEKFKLKDKNDLMKTQRQLVISKKQGGKLTGPKKQFVLSTHLDPVHHGEWDPAKGVEHWADGALRKGVWRNTDPEGFYDFEAYEDLFAEEPFQAKKRVALDNMQDQMSFAGLVQGVTSLGHSSSSSAAVPFPDGASGKETTSAGAETIAESSDSSSSSSAEEEEAAAGLNSLIGSRLFFFSGLPPTQHRLSRQLMAFLLWGCCQACKSPAGSALVHQSHEGLAHVSRL